MKISIIIPTIGRKTLKTVLAAIFDYCLSESHEVEVLVVFDGKKNLSLEEFSSKTKDNRLKILETGKSQGAAATRNLGIKSASGDILVFIGDNGIPDKNWLGGVFEFHEKFPEKEKALLGNVLWQNTDDFTSFFEKNFQFDFANIKKNGANWRHFYTSNISIKRELLEIPNGACPPLAGMANGEWGTANVKEFGISDFFNEKFSGWGFEDSEFGYRLEKRGMRIFFDENCQIFRLDSPNLDSLIEKTKSARKNAKIFEKLHPEVEILPRGSKLYFLEFGIWILGFLNFIPQIKWWRTWKKAWIGGKD